jgi:hypothetical protein
MCGTRVQDDVRGGNLNSKYPLAGGIAVEWQYTLYSPVRGFSAGPFNPPPGESDNKAIVSHNPSFRSGPQPAPAMLF